ncbi:hypothetical protein [Erwinia psidii]|uniref:hypothetical protein n=1 Tax=Erwinia psidii TaxID=69224 RepID=UPI00226B8F74|nr:hypothetical protein [Erwinia psidii]
MNAKIIATTILKQLGSNKFLAMTGAKNLVSTEKGGLNFRLPSNFSNKGINLVCISLEPCDMYTMKFYKIRGTSIKLIDESTMIYADELKSIFTLITGLDTHL